VPGLSRLVETVQREHNIDRKRIFATGFSGHGFKFTSALGEVLARMALTGASPLPIEFLRAGRFAAK
jgi:glycine/D-amino acid oxidase-like deaminating enzyme